MQVAKEAAEDAERLLRSVWLRDRQVVPLPVDPVQIARTLGIDVYDARLDQNIFAALVKELGQDPTILLNTIDSPNRKRFSCAHEIGHFMRRSDDEYEYVDRRGPLSSAGTDPEEIYANNFAAALLMPEAEVRRLYKKDATDVEMALIFDVSREAMGFRLKNLGLARK
jgi:Zn-dependent peptidase ImmA (M78 family)